MPPCFFSFTKGTGASARHYTVRVIRAKRGFAVAPEPGKNSNDIDQTDDAGDFDESSDLCDFGYVLVRRESNPAGATRDDSNG